MRLDKTLTSQQLWTIASDTEHRNADLLDQLVDHPATYRALSDWAVAALAEEDLRAIAPPPLPEDEPEPARKVLRFPSVGRSRQKKADSLVSRTPVDIPSPSSAIVNGSHPNPENDPSESHAILTPDTSSTSGPPAFPPQIRPERESHVEAESHVGAWLNVSPLLADSGLSYHYDSGQPSQSTALPALRSSQGTASTEAVPGNPGPQRSELSWTQRPAPMGIVVLLVVLQLLTVFALGYLIAKAYTPAQASARVQEDG